jgi:hypothetical protein
MSKDICRLHARMARILQTDASLWKEEKTLSFSQRPNVWDSVWTGCLADGSLPTYVITDHCEPYARCTLILSTAAQERANTPNTPNTVHLPSIHTLFPHLSPWDGTTDHAVTLLAELLGYRRIFTDSAAASSPASSPGPSHPSIQRIHEPPRPLFLIAEYAQESFEQNLRNPYIDRLFLYNLPKEVTNPKVEAIASCITFADLFSRISTLPPSYVAFTRPGIVLDDWRDLWTIPMKKTLLSLLSYEIPSSGNLEERTLPPVSDLQDCWVIRSEDVPSGKPSKTFQIPLLQAKSECAFAFRMLQEKFLVVNPARSLVTWRTLSLRQTPLAESPVYHLIHPTGINERKPLLTTPVSKTLLKRTVEGSDATRWLHALSKKGIAIPLGTSDYTHRSQEVLSLDACVQTVSGLAFDASTMYVGGGKGAQEAWSVETLYALLPTECHDVGIIVPFYNVQTEAECLLHVISKLLLNKRNAVYVCPDWCRDLFAKFGLTSTLSQSPERHIMYKKALCYPVDQEVSPSAIRSLRESMAWIPEPRLFDGRHSIVCMNSSFEEALRGAWDVRVLQENTSYEQRLANLSGAWGIVIEEGEDPLWNWMLPLGARVFELSSTDTKAHHLSTVAGLKHIFTTRTRLLESIADTP